ncbi:MAG TPA: amidohydrolase family protein, partial [Ilumatobacteraceae bacterium]|nr:amidohydrolase family protein [Ilumatobacteraceae bacterium]
LQACQDTDTTISMHIGSSSSMPTTADDAPLATSMSLYAQNAQGSLCDWIFSGRLSMFPTLKIAYAESQVGWMPFQLERMDSVWRDGVGDVNLATAPSLQAAGRVYGCIFDDLHGLRVREWVGIDQILFETDYPHSDGTFPHSRKIAHEMFVAAGMNADECYKVLRGNAIQAYGLHRFGITK